MIVKITDIHEHDMFYSDRDLIIGQIGEFIVRHERKLGWYSGDFRVVPTDRYVTFYRVRIEPVESN